MKRREKELQLGDLLTFIEGTASDEVKETIKQSADLLQKAEDIALWSATLEAVTIRQECPSAWDLMLYDDQTLHPLKRRIVDLHLKHCDPCQSDLAEIRAVDAKYHLPSSIAQKAKEAWESAKQEGKRIIEAVLLPMPTPAVHLRGKDETRESVYQAEDFKIVLAIEPPLAAENLWQLEGQVMSFEVQDPLLSQGKIQLLQNNHLVGEDNIDDFGYFALENISAGSYQVHFDWQDTSFVIQDFQVS